MQATGTITLSEEAFGPPEGVASFASVAFSASNGQVIVIDGLGVKSWAPTPALSGCIMEKRLNLPVARQLFHSPLNDVIIAVAIGPCTRAGSAPDTILILHPSLSVMREFGPGFGSDAPASWTILCACMNPWNNELLLICQRTLSGETVSVAQSWSIIRDGSTGILHVLKKWESVLPHDARLLRCVNAQMQQDAAQSLVAIVTCGGDVVVWDSMCANCLGWIDANAFGKSPVSTLATDITGKLIIMGTQDGRCSLWCVKVGVVDPENPSGFQMSCLSRTRHAIAPHPIVALSIGHTTESFFALCADGTLAHVSTSTCESIGQVRLPPASSSTLFPCAVIVPAHVLRPEVENKRMLFVALGVHVSRVDVSSRHALAPLAPVEDAYRGLLLPGRAHDLRRFSAGVAARASMLNVAFIRRCDYLDAFLVGTADGAVCLCHPDDSSLTSGRQGTEVFLQGLATKRCINDVLAPEAGTLTVACVSPVQPAYVPPLLGGRKSVSVTAPLPTSLLRAQTPREPSPLTIYPIPQAALRGGTPDIDKAPIAVPASRRKSPPPVLEAPAPVAAFTLFVGGTDGSVSIINVPLPQQEDDDATLSVTVQRRGAHTSPVLAVEFVYRLQADGSGGAAAGTDFLQRQGRVITLDRNGALIWDSVSLTVLASLAFPPALASSYTLHVPWLATTVDAITCRGHEEAVAWFGAPPIVAGTASGDVSAYGFQWPSWDVAPGPTGPILMRPHLLGNSVRYHAGPVTAIVTLQPHDVPVHAAHLGTQFATGSSDGVIIVWHGPSLLPLRWVCLPSPVWGLCMCSSRPPLFPLDPPSAPALFVDLGSQVAVVPDGELFGVALNAHGWPLELNDGEEASSSLHSILDLRKLGGGTGPPTPGTVPALALSSPEALAAKAGGRKQPLSDFAPPPLTGKVIDVDLGLGEAEAPVHNMPEFPRRTGRKASQTYTARVHSPAPSSRPEAATPGTASVGATPDPLSATRRSTYAVGVDESLSAARAAATAKLRLRQEAKGMRRSYGQRSATSLEDGYGYGSWRGKGRRAGAGGVDATVRTVGTTDSPFSHTGMLVVDLGPAKETLELVQEAVGTRMPMVTPAGVGTVKLMSISNTIKTCHEVVDHLLAVYEGPNPSSRFLPVTKVVEAMFRRSSGSAVALSKAMSWFASVVQYRAVHICRVMGVFLGLIVLPPGHGGLSPSAVLAFLDCLRWVRERDGRGGARQVPFLFRTQRAQQSSPLSAGGITARPSTSPVGKQRSPGPRLPRKGSHTEMIGLTSWSPQSNGNMTDRLTTPFELTRPKSSSGLPSPTKSPAVHVSTVKSKLAHTTPARTHTEPVLQSCVFQAPLVSLVRAFDCVKTVFKSCVSPDKIWQLIERVNDLPIVMEEDPPGLSSMYLELDALLELIVDTWLMWSEGHAHASALVVDGLDLPEGEQLTREVVSGADTAFFMTGGLASQSDGGAHPLSSNSSSSVLSSHFQPFNHAWQVLTACLAADPSRCGLLPYAAFAKVMMQQLNWPPAAASRHVADIVEYFCVNEWAHGEPVAPPRITRSWVFGSDGQWEPTPHERCPDAARASLVIDYGRFAAAFLISLDQMHLMAPLSSPSPQVFMRVLSMGLAEYGVSGSLRRAVGCYLCDATLMRAKNVSSLLFGEGRRAGEPEPLPTPVKPPEAKSLLLSSSLLAGAQIGMNLGTTPLTNTYLDLQGGGDGLRITPAPTRTQRAVVGEIPQTLDAQRRMYNDAMGRIAVFRGGAGAGAAELAASLAASEREREREWGKESAPRSSRSHQSEHHTFQPVQGDGPRPLVFGEPGYAGALDTRDLHGDAAMFTLSPTAEDEDNSTAHGSEDFILGSPMEGSLGGMAVRFDGSHSYAGGGSAGFVLDPQYGGGSAGGGDGDALPLLTYKHPSETAAEKGAALGGLQGRTIGQVDPATAHLAGLSVPLEAVLQSLDPTAPAVNSILQLYDGNVNHPKLKRSTHRVLIPVIDAHGGVMGHIPRSSVGKAPWIVQFPSPQVTPQARAPTDRTSLHSKYGDDNFAVSTSSPVQRAPNLPPTPTGPAAPMTLLPIVSSTGVVVGMQQVQVEGTTQAGGAPTTVQVGYLKDHALAHLGELASRQRAAEEQALLQKFISVKEGVLPRKAPLWGRRGGDPHASASHAGDSSDEGGGGRGRASQRRQSAGAVSPSRSDTPTNRRHSVASPEHMELDPILRSHDYFGIISAGLTKSKPSEAVVLDAESSDQAGSGPDEVGGVKRASKGKGKEKEKEKGGAVRASDSKGSKTAAGKAKKGADAGETAGGKAGKAGTRHKGDGDVDGARGSTAPSRTAGGDKAVGKGGGVGGKEDGEGERIAKKASGKKKGKGKAKGHGRRRGGDDDDMLVGTAVDSAHEWSADDSYEEGSATDTSLVLEGEGEEGGSASGARSPAGKSRSAVSKEGEAEAVADPATLGQDGVEVEGQEAAPGKGENAEAADSSSSSDFEFYVPPDDEAAGGGNGDGDNVSVSSAGSGHFAVAEEGQGDNASAPVGIVLPLSPVRSGEGSSGGLAGEGGDVSHRSRSSGVHGEKSAGRSRRSVNFDPHVSVRSLDDGPPSSRSHGSQRRGSLGEGEEAAAGVQGDSKGSSGAVGGEHGGSHVDLWASDPVALPSLQVSLGSTHALTTDAAAALALGGLGAMGGGDGRHGGGGGTPAHRARKHVRLGDATAVGQEEDDYTEGNLLDGLVGHLSSVASQGSSGDDDTEAARRARRLSRQQRLRANEEEAAQRRAAREPDPNKRTSVGKPAPLLKPTFAQDVNFDVLSLGSPKKKANYLGNLSLASVGASTAKSFRTRRRSLPKNTPTPHGYDGDDAFVEELGGWNRAVRGQRDVWEEGDKQARLPVSADVLNHMMDETVSKRQVAGRRGALLRGRSFNKLKPARAIDSIVRANRSIRCARQTNADIAAAVRARRQSVQADVPSGGDSSEEEYVSSSEPQSESDGSFTPIPEDEDELEIQRRRLHEIDRSDWPAVVMQYGLGWDEYFDRQEQTLFGRGLRVKAPDSLKSPGPTPRLSSPKAGDRSQGAGQTASPISITLSESLSSLHALSPAERKELPKIRVDMKVREHLVGAKEIQVTKLALNSSVSGRMERQGDWAYFELKEFADSIITFTLTGVSGAVECFVSTLTLPSTLDFIWRPMVSTSGDQRLVIYPSDPHHAVIGTKYYVGVTLVGQGPGVFELRTHAVTLQQDKAANKHVFHAVDEQIKVLKSLEEGGRSRSASRVINQTLSPDVDTGAGPADVIDSEDDTVSIARSSSSSDAEPPLPDLGSASGLSQLHATMGARNADLFSGSVSAPLGGVPLAAPPSRAATRQKLLERMARVPTAAKYSLDPSPSLASLRLPGKTPLGSTGGVNKAPLGSAGGNSKTPPRAAPAPAKGKSKGKKGPRRTALLRSLVATVESGKALQG